MTQIALIWLMLTVVMVVATEAGYRIYKATHRGGRPAGDAGFSLSGILSLVSLLTAFTFNLANSRYDLRRDLVVAEATAISTTFLRQQLLAAPDRILLTHLMRDYVVARRKVVGDEVTDPQIVAAQRQGAELQSRIWRLTRQALQTPEGAQVGTPLITATNQMFELSEARRAAIEARIPPREIRVLLILVLGSAVMTGIVLASKGSRQLVAASTMSALLALVMSLINDLDTSHSGGIRTSYAALDRVEQLIVHVDDGFGSGQPAPADRPAQPPAR
jgi:hypothetical protein